MGLTANGLNIYTKSEVGKIIHILDIPSMLSTVNSNGTNKIDILKTRYINMEVDGLISTSYNNAETDNMLNRKINTSGNRVIHNSLEANVTRCGEINMISDDDLNSLTLTQLSANRSIIDLRTEEPYAYMYLEAKGFPHIGLPTTNKHTKYKDTTIDGILATGSTTINGDVTADCNLAHTGDDSYTNSEIDDILNFILNTTGNTTINGDVQDTGNLTYNGDSNSDSYTKTGIYNKLFLKVNQSYGEKHSKLRIHGGLEASVENPLYVKNQQLIQIIGHPQHFIN